MVIDGCLAGDIPQLRRWAQQGVRVANANPLRLSAFHGKLNVVRLLIQELGATVDQENEEWGWTALHAAACEGHVAVVRGTRQEIWR
jgi:ankyrin repeat protein